MARVMTNILLASFLKDSTKREQDNHTMRHDGRAVQLPQVPPLYSPKQVTNAGQNDET